MSTHRHKILYSHTLLLFCAVASLLIVMIAYGYMRLRTGVALEKAMQAHQARITAESNRSQALMVSRIFDDTKAERERIAKAFI